MFTDWKRKPMLGNRVLAASAVIFLVLLSASASWSSNEKPAPGSTADIAERWGIEVVSMRQTAADNMLDFRYKVLDAKKAAAVFERTAKPYLIHQASGKVLSVPRTAKVGPLRSSDQPQEGRTYWMFFGNQTKLVKAGDKVTVVIGEFKAEDLTVQ